MTDPISLGIAATSTKILNNLVDDVYNSIKHEIKLQSRKSAINKKIPSLYSRITSIRLVKTLWQVDRAVDVESYLMFKFI